MKIIYMHHAERKISEKHKDAELRQLEDITDYGEEEANLLARKFRDVNITAIVTSPYIRCMHTAQIINEYHNARIIEDDRFNEMKKNESKEEFLKRNMQAIDNIVNIFDDDSVIVCITSGVNLTAFICYFYNINPTEQTPLSQAATISPINFTIGKNMLD